MPPYGLISPVLMGTTKSTHPSFGMTTTQAIGTFLRDQNYVVIDPRYNLHMNTIHVLVLRPNSNSPSDVDIIAMIIMLMSCIRNLLFINGTNANSANAVTNLYSPMNIPYVVWSQLNGCLFKNR